MRGCRQHPGGRGHTCLPAPGSNRQGSRPHYPPTGKKIPNSFDLRLKGSSQRFLFPSNWLPDSNTVPAAKLLHFWSFLKGLRSCQTSSCLPEGYPHFFCCLCNFPIWGQTTHTHTGWRRTSCIRGGILQTLASGAEGLGRVALNPCELGP